MLRLSPANIYIASSDFTGKTFLINLLEIHWNDCNTSLIEFGWWEGQFTWDLLFWGFWRRYVYKLWHKLFPPKSREPEKSYLVRIADGYLKIVPDGYTIVQEAYCASTFSCNAAKILAKEFTVIHSPAHVEEYKPTFPGLEHLITTGFAEETKGEPCPPLESEVT